MSDQLSFDFSDLACAFKEHAAGTWNHPSFSTAQYVDRFALAEAALLGIEGPGRTMLAKGLAAAKAQHVEMLDRCDRGDGSYQLWRSNFEPTADELAAFVAHCDSNAEAAALTGARFAGSEYKTRREQRGYRIAAMFARDVGTVIVRHWPTGGASADFHLFRDPFFLDSYRDGMPALYAPCAIWARSYCADKLAESGDGVASVRTFGINGREYINTGGMGAGAYRECSAFAFRPVADWTGPTYSYKTQGAATDAGRIERGDRRGLVVRVRGQLCVLDSAALVYDDQVTTTYVAGDESDDDYEDIEA